MNSYVLLLLALLPLLAGPFISRWADRSEVARSMMDSLVAVTLGGIVLLHIWPGAYRAAGPAALALGLLGFALPFLLHGRLHAHEERAFPGLMWLAFLGLALHALLDGVALFSPESEHHRDRSGSMLLAVAVVLHRLPTALAIWWLVSPRLGKRSAAILLGSVGAATVLGFATADRLLGHLSAPGLSLFEAGVAGMLMHIVFGHEHRHGAASSLRPSRATSAVGALAGAALLAAVGYVHALEPVDLDPPATSWTLAEAARLMALPLVLAFSIWAVRSRETLYGIRAKPKSPAAR